MSLGVGLALGLVGFAFRGFAVRGTLTGFGCALALTGLGFRALANGLASLRVFGALRLRDSGFGLTGFRFFGFAVRTLGLGRSSPVPRLGGAVNLPKASLQTRLVKS